MTPKKVVVDTDVIVDHLTHVASSKHQEASSVLRKASAMFFCYTTVFNAIELFALCETEEERRAVEDSMHALKILGLNSKSGKSLGLMMRRFKKGKVSEIEVLIAGLCAETKLPLLTGRTSKFQKIVGLKLIPASLVRRYSTAEEVFSHAL